MADIPQPEPIPGPSAADETDPPWVWHEVDLSRGNTVLQIVPVSIFSGLVTTGAMFEISQWVAHRLNPGRPGAIPGYLIVIYGLASFVLTLRYFTLHLNEDFTKTRVRGQFQIRRRTHCPSCRATLIVGQLICESCGSDLRSSQDLKLPPRHLRRQMLLSHVLGTVPIANLAFALSAWVTGLWGGWGWRDATALLPLTLAVTGVVVALRIPRAIELWRFVRAEEAESRVEPK